MSYYFTILSPTDTPIFNIAFGTSKGGGDGIARFRFPDTAQYMNQFIIHSSLDIVEEAQWTNGGMWAYITYHRSYFQTTQLSLFSLRKIFSISQSHLLIDELQIQVPQAYWYLSTRCCLYLRLLNSKWSTISPSSSTSTASLQWFKRNRFLLASWLVRVHHASLLKLHRR